MTRLTQTMIAATVMLAACPAAWAQEPMQGRTDFVVLAGVYSEGGAVIGGGVQYALRPRWLLAGESGFLTGEAPGPGPGVVNLDRGGFAIDGNAHYLLPGGSNSEFTPYLLGGMGLIHRRGEYRDFFQSHPFSRTDFGLNLGAGTRWRAGDHWGLRPELKLFVGHGHNLRFSLGAFLRFD